MSFSLPPMASASASLVYFILLVFSAAAEGAPPKPSNHIKLGSSLSPVSQPSPWPSPSGLFAFGFYQQGPNFAVGIWLVGDNVTVVWTANRDDPPVNANATLNLTMDGKLLLRTDQGQEKLLADAHASAAFAALLDSGNFVLYNKHSGAIWQSFNSPTDTILGGQWLFEGNQLVSSSAESDHPSGLFLLSMQEDGNLVSYPVNSSGQDYDAYWSSGTPWGYYSTSLYLSTKGHLYLHSASIHYLWNSSYSSNNTSSIYLARLDPDGIFRLYSHRFENNGTSTVSNVWSSLSDQCAVKGFCGFNSYCSSPGIKAQCLCLPGFDWNKPGEKIRGCSRIFSVDDCSEINNQMMSYNITRLENMWWGDHAYKVKSMKMEDCSKFCLDDCECEAALYSNRSCSKYRLLIKYAKKNANQTFTALLRGDLHRVKSANTAPPAPMNPVKTDGKKTLVLVLSLSLGSVAFLCSIIAVSSFWIYRRQLGSYTHLLEEAKLGSTEEFTLQSFSYDELEKATDGFREKLGKGTYGSVYMGTIRRDGKIVAVKRLEKVVEQGEKEFQAEMTVIGRTQHRNLIRLLGFCIEGSRKLLVYEFMKNGSLADLLFNAEKRPIWKERVRIALELARGILYLHEECESPIIHCDIKPQNILMDNVWTVKIADFGFSKLLMPNQEGIVTRVRGTAGYCAPEWHKNTPISVKADVYSFGAVLLEIVCCRRCIDVDVSTADEIILSNWMYGCLVARELDKLVGDEQVDIKSLERMVKVGLLCVQDDPGLRPPMKNVILMLEGAVDIPFPPSPCDSK